MPQFNVGDRVKRIDPRGGAQDVDRDFPVGSEGIVIAIYRPDTDHELVEVRADNGTSIRMKPIRFELVVHEAPVRAFQVGDRVRCINSDQWSREGWIGTVCRVQNGTELNIKVDWQDNRGLWISERNIALIPEVAVHQAPQQEGTVFWSVVYRTRGRLRKQVMGFETRGDAEQKKADVLRNGGTVFGMKKLTLRGVA